MIPKFPNVLPSDLNAVQLDRIREQGAKQNLFPPDFLHGNAELDELYGSFEAWAERLVFVRPVFVSGRCVAASVAYFDDWFLGIEHRFATAEEAVLWAQRLASQRGGIVIELALEQSLQDDRPEWVVVRCDRNQLGAMETAELDVTRDAALSEEMWWQTAQTDLLSAVCLTARLGRLN